MPRQLPKDTPLEAVIAYLEGRVEKGTICPACDQHVKKYTRPINTGQAKALINWYSKKGRHWAKISELGNNTSREEAKLRFWGLVEEKRSPFRRKNGTRSGEWRITERGEDFVLGRITVPKYVELYDGEFLRLTGDEVSIQECLGQAFNYYALMGYAAPSAS